MTKTHTAVVFPSKGGRLEEQKIVSPVNATAGKVIVQVEYASPTPLDVWQGIHGLLVQEWPLIPSDAFTGIVIDVANDVEHLKKGDKVFSFTFGPNEVRAGQEIVVLPANRVGKVPDNISLEEAATVPNNLVTAFHSLTHDLKIPLLDDAVDDALKNKRILIWGGGTSVGQYAVQVLSLSGYKSIITTASSHHHDYLRSIGATETVDYRSDSWKADVGDQVDLVLDCVGDVDESLRKIAQIVAPKPGSIVAALLPLRYGGKKVSKVGFELDEGVLPKEVTYFGVRTHFYEENEHYKHTLQPKIIPDLLASGKIKPNKVRVVTEGGSRLANYQKAIDDLANGDVSGEKLVIKMN